MAARMQIHIDAAKAMLDALVDLLDAGAGAGTLEIWEAVAGANPPAQCETVISDDDTNYKLLAVLTLSDPAFGAASDNGTSARATASAITQDSSANKTGTAEFFRAKDSNGKVIIQGNCGTSAADLIMPTTSITATQPVQVSSWTIDLSEG